MRSNRAKLREPRFMLDAKKHFLTVRTPRVWNGFPREVVEAPSVRVFKDRLDMHMVGMSTDRFDRLAVQGTRRSLLQHHNPKASVLRHSAFLMVQLSQPYIATGKTVALTIYTFVGRVMSLLFKSVDSCPRNCYGNGDCVSGNCRCFLGFLGPDCGRASCPVLCSGNGQYMKGRCLCHSGWKGAECDVPTSQCIDVSCSSHGTCIMGTCICNPGYKGESCEEAMQSNLQASTSMKLQEKLQSFP
ncbi:Teneurin-4 [Varanus komodoensis]|nr:Teneurin-4 [Varanus komodoensis]